MLTKLLPLEESLPLFDVASSRDIEASGPAGLMECAGLAIAKLAQALQPQGTIWIVCGPGNNGGDGEIAARHLIAQGWSVQVSHPLKDGVSPPPNVGLVIDALLGLGLNRAPAPAIADAIACINALNVPVLALDLPSGLLADTGALAGPAVRATHTLALLTLKPGLFTAEGREHCGELWFDDLDVQPEPAPTAHLLGGEVMRSWLTPTSHSANKGSRGDVIVIGGAANMQGAASLAAGAALAAGAGRVYVDLLTDAPLTRPELMHWSGGTELDGRTVVCGCGGGQRIAARLPALLAGSQRLVLDADALNAVAADNSLATALNARPAPTLLTPHPLEAARLLGTDTASVQADRLRAASALANQFNTTVVLKGSGTVIAAPGRTPAVNSSGNASLATAGTGDVLAGWLGGLWAQAPRNSAFDVACAGVYWHGRAGESQATGPLRANDLIERMHGLFKTDARSHQL
ncbi:MAG TPA: NAD(P)H-hydrate dehydratase [Burkholderiaceae bacterium]|jgi:hydroxyethylthiazole kinase-like uncharacterized protein yjeF